MAGAAPDWSPYRFGLNNPIRYTNPTGMYEDDIYYHKGEEVSRVKNNQPDRTFDISKGDKEGVWTVNRETTGEMGSLSSGSQITKSEMWNDAANTLSGVSTFIGAVGMEVDRSLGRRQIPAGAWGDVRGAVPTGHVPTAVPSTPIRTPLGQVNVPTNDLTASKSVMKYGGRGLGALGLVGTYAQWQTGAIGNGEAALDAAFGGVGFIPGYGWAVSGAYFLVAKPIYKHYTEP